MKNKKKAIIVIVCLAVVLGIVAAALTFYFTNLHNDENDTEEFFRQNVASVNYDNTVETAYPQTDLYGIIENHFKSALPEGKTEKKVAVIGYDGCRADILAEKKENGAVGYLLANGASCNLTYCGGVNYPAKNTQDTSTAPGWCSILTGVWADTHGIKGNGIVKEVEPKTLVTSLVEDGTIDSSVFITKWKGHFTKNNSTYRDEKAHCEENGIAADFVLRDGLEDVHTGAMEEIGKADCADFVFIIYEDTDSAGHNTGFSFNNPAYKEGFGTEDAYGYEVIRSIEARETYETEDWLIIVTSDHGGIGDAHGGASIQERMTFVVMNKEWN
ncbi:MAG: alkaline phosphatase family protein [Clostridia bacterium]|nr:alkaline phosphatase family protein [Clostridia bacterium]